MKRIHRTPGQRLLAWRIRHGWSQRQAAAKVGVAQASWSEWENDKKAPRIEHAVQIARITRGACPVEMFAGGLAAAGR